MFKIWEHWYFKFNFSINVSLLLVWTIKQKSLNKCCTRNKRLLYVLINPTIEKRRWVKLALPFWESNEGSINEELHNICQCPPTTATTSFANIWYTKYKIMSTLVFEGSEFPNAFGSLGQNCHKVSCYRHPNRGKSKTKQIAKLSAILVRPCQI